MKIEKSSSSTALIRWQCDMREGMWLGAWDKESFDEFLRIEREAIIAAIPGGSSVDPQWVCDMIRGRNEKD